MQSHQIIPQQTKTCGKNNEEVNISPPPLHSSTRLAEQRIRFFRLRI